MRKLKLQMQITIDGFIAGDHGEMDWMTFAWTDDIKTIVGEISSPVGTILLGRKLAEGFIPHWASRPTYEDPWAIDKFNNTPKVVFTHSLTTHNWANTSLATGDLRSEIDGLKQQPGGDMIAYGGGGFASSLIKEGLVDEYDLFVNPVAIGHGMTIFGSLQNRRSIRLVRSVAFDCGIALLQYIHDRNEIK